MIEVKNIKMLGNKVSAQLQKFFHLIRIWILQKLHSFLKGACRKKWFGTAPFCEGSCPEDWQQLERGSAGDGASCWTGAKVLCQHCDPTPKPECSPTETETECYHSVKICKNIERIAGSDGRPNGDTRVCSSYICGTCDDDSGFTK